MSEIDYETKRDGLMYAVKVKLLASEDAPDSYSAKLTRMLATQLEKNYGFNSREKKIAILQHIRKVGTSSIAELCEHFPWHRDLITNLIGELEAAARIEFYTQPPAGDRGGRPSRRIRLTVAGGFAPPEN